MISVGIPINHEAIFVETHESGVGTGHIFQVSGNIQQGMFHNHHRGSRPEEDETSVFVSKSYLGKVRRTDYDNGCFRDVCDNMEPPPKQFDGPKRLFPGKKLRRCGEWAKDVAQKLREENILLVD